MSSILLRPGYASFLLTPPSRKVFLLSHSPFQESLLEFCSPPFSSILVFFFRMSLSSFSLLLRHCHLSFSAQDMLPSCSLLLPGKSSFFLTPPSRKVFLLSHSSFQESLPSFSLLLAGKSSFFLTPPSRSLPSFSLLLPGESSFFLIALLRMYLPSSHCASQEMSCLFLTAPPK